MTNCFYKRPIYMSIKSRGCNGCILEKKCMGNTCIYNSNSNHTMACDKYMHIKNRSLSIGFFLMFGYDAQYEE